MRAPDRAAIYAAELRFAESKRTIRDSLRRVRVAFRATLARPFTLGLVAGSAGLFGFWLARRPQVRSGGDGVAVAKTTSARGLVLAFLMRYAMQRLPLILRQVWAAREKSAASRVRH